MNMDAITYDSNEATENVPKWLESKLFESVLKEIFVNFKKVDEFIAYTALPVEKTSSTVITRIEFFVELQDGSFDLKFFILKTPNDLRLYKDLIVTDSFVQEPKVYEHLIPAFETLYQEAGKVVKFAAKYYKLDTQEKNVLLDDLSQMDFRKANRLECMNMEQAKNVLQKIAQWHAASAVYKETVGYDETYRTATFKAEGRIPTGAFFGNAIALLLRCLHLYVDPEEYREKIEKLLTCLTDEIFQPVQVDDNDFNVLNHSHLWTDNIMFLYDDGGQELLETYFVDYSYPKCGSPAQDLFYFIVSSVQADIKTKQFDYLIHYYHLNLVENLQLLHYPKMIPTLAELHVILHKYSIWGFHTAAIVLSAVLLDESETTTSDDVLAGMEDGDIPDIPMFANERYIQHMKVILPWLLNRGSLDFP